MNIVVAGGTGLLGSAITAELVRLGHSVSILSRAPHSGSTVNMIAWDGRGRGSWEDAVTEADAVINVSGHSIGAGRWTQRQKQRIRESRINATKALVDAIGRAGRKPKVLVNASAVGYYGHVAEGDVDESHPPGDDFLAKTCIDWEAAALRAKEHGVRVVQPRNGFVLAPNADAFKKMLMPFQFFAGGPFGSGEQWFPWIHLDDIVRGYIHAIETSSLEGPANLVAPFPVRVDELARELGKALRRPAFLRAPAFGLKILLGEMADLLLKGQRAVPNRLLKSGMTFRFPMLPEALKDIVMKRRKE